MLNEVWNTRSLVSIEKYLVNEWIKENRQMIMLFEIVDILIVMPIDPDEHPSPIKRKVKRN